MMKRIVALLLALIMCFVLCACGNNQSENSNDTNATNDTNEQVEFKDGIKFNETNIIAEDAEITFTYAFSADAIDPPIKESSYISFSAEDGKEYLVLAANVKNTTDTTATISDLFCAKLSIGKEKNLPAEYFLITDGGAGVTARGTIDALATGSVFIAFSVDPSVVNNTAILTITDNGGNDLEGTFKLTDFEKETLSIGDTVATENLEFTIKDVSFMNALYPPKPSDYYHYVEAPDGKILLVVSCYVKNLKGTDLGCDNIAEVSCVYNDKYNYSSYVVLDENNGQDLTSYASINSIAPLDSNNIYYVIEVPQEVESGSSEITFYIDTAYYKYSVTA